MGRIGRYIILSMIAMSVLAGVWAQSPAELQRRREAVREVAARADAGNPEALFQMSKLYERGYDSIPRDSVMALQLLRRAADAGYPDAENLLGFKLISGADGLPRNPDEGLARLEHSAILGNPKAISNLGYLLLYGEGVEHDPAKAAYWLRRAADDGILSAASMLGDLYRDGNGVPRDSIQAASLYRMAFDKGLTDAGYKLFDLSQNQINTLPAPALLKEGLYYFRRSLPHLGVAVFRRLSEDSIECQEVRAHAKALLGDAYSRGRGADYDYALSTRYYLEAAREGNPSAQFIIGEMLEIFPDALADTLREDDPDDYRSAHYWLGRAAEAGVDDASEAIHRLHE